MVRVAPFLTHGVVRCDVSNVQVSNSLDSAEMRQVMIMIGSLRDNPAP